MPGAEEQQKSFRCFENANFSAAETLVFAAASISDPCADQLHNRHGRANIQGNVRTVSGQSRALCVRKALMYRAMHNKASILS